MKIRFFVAAALAVFGATPYARAQLVVYKSASPGFAVTNVNSIAAATGSGLTFIPSGTNVSKFTGASVNAFIGSDSSPAYSDLWLGVATNGVTNFSLSSNGTLLQVNSAGIGPIQFSLANSEKARIAASTGDLLVGGLTVDGTGVVQFPAATTNAGGINFGTEIYFFRTGTNTAQMSASGGFAFTGTVQTAGYARVTNDVTNATATMSNLTNLLVTVASGVKYVGTIQVFANDSTGADGLAFDLGGGGATFTDLEFGFAAQPTGSTLGTVTSTAATTPITLTVVSTSDAVYTISFGFTCNAGGTFIPRFAQNSHSAGTATVRKNSGTVTLASSN